MIGPIEDDGLALRQLTMYLESHGGLRATMSAWGGHQFPQTVLVQLVQTYDSPTTHCGHVVAHAQGSTPAEAIRKCLVEAG